MEPLKIDPPVPLLIPEGTVQFALVGCGGTGSHIAQSLARLAAHARDQGGDVRLVFIDGDQVEATTVGRQLFSAADVGQNKAQALAARFGLVFGLKIAAYPEMASRELLNRIGAYQARTTNILVGAVDGAEGRKVLHGAISDYWWRLWVDAGNHEWSGQVAAGTAHQVKDLAGSFALGGICSQLPAPTLLYPELLTPAPKRVRADCAAAVEDNAQGLMVNQMMASIVAHYCYEIAFQRQLTRFQTVVDLRAMSMRSTSITAANVAAACGISVEKLLKPERKAA